MPPQRGHRYEHAQGLPHLYRGARSKGARADIYATDHADTRHGGRFRWMISTCLAAVVGALAIVVVIYGAADPRDSADGFIPTLDRIRKDTELVPMPEPSRPDDGLKWAVAKTDRLQMTTGAMSTRFVIHETLKQRRNGREYIYAKPYVRILARLAPVPQAYADVIPTFNPVKLFADVKPVGQDGAEQSAQARSDVSVHVVELLGGFLPGEDGQELDAAEVEELVARAGEDSTAGALSLPGSQDEIGGPVRGPGNFSGDGDFAESQLPNTTVLAKTAEDQDIADDLESQEVRVIKVKSSDTLTRILTAQGADVWQAREMIEPAKSILPDNGLEAGDEVHVALVPSLTDPGKLEPVSFSVYGGGHSHRLTVRLSPAGEFVASADPVEQPSAIRAALGGQERGANASLYASLYHASLVQQLTTETIQQVLKVHAYETDFRRRLRADDTAEFFFDLRHEGGLDGPPGELLFTSLTTGGDTSRYYRFRAADGSVDYYDADGNNSRKFLLRKPIRGDELRLTSGFGVRFHPLLGVRKMHTGIDWAAPTGTPILAAGNGTIEEAGRKSAYGNYVRIRHANGYQTAYGHMSRIAPGVEPGVKVRQGQVIGYVGSTGLSSGPHLHYEVLVNTRFVDPLSIQVPRERKLTGKDLAEFQKERARIDELMRRSPVMTASK